METADDLQQLNLLIDKASAIAGSDSKLAATLGIQKQWLSNMRHGRKTATPEDRALLAMVAGLDPIAELARAMVQKHEGTKKGDLLMRALGKSSRATGAALVSVGAGALAIYGAAQVLIDTMYRKVDPNARFAFAFTR